MDKTELAILTGGIGALAGGIGGYYFGLQKGIEQGEMNIFTNHGIPNTLNELLGELQARGYTTETLQILTENATIWEIQLLLAAHMVAENHGLPNV